MPITKASSSAVAPGAKGELVVGNATNDSGILSVGANGTVLTADSAEATGVKWGTISAGGMTLLSTTTLSGTSVTVSSINQSYNSLYLVAFGISHSTASTYSIRIAPNGDTGLCAQVSIGMSGSSTVVDNQNATYLYLSNNSGSNKPTGSNNNNIYTAQINNYASTTSRKSFAVQAGFVDGFSSAFRAYQGTGGINTTSALTSLTITNDQNFSFTSGTLLIYGVK